MLLEMSTKWQLFEHFLKILHNRHKKQRNLLLIKDVNIRFFHNLSQFLF